MTIVTLLLGCDNEALVDAEALRQSARASMETRAEYLAQGDFEAKCEKADQGRIDTARARDVERVEVFARCVGCSEPQSREACEEYLGRKVALGGPSVFKEVRSEASPDLENPLGLSEEHVRLRKAMGAPLDAVCSGSEKRAGAVISNELDIANAGPVSSGEQLERAERRAMKRAAKALHMTGKQVNELWITLQMKCPEATLSGM